MILIPWLLAGALIRQEKAQFGPMTWTNKIPRTTLGLSRAAIGAGASKTDSPEEQRLTYVSGLEVSMMLFPQGRSDERFLINPLIRSHIHGNDSIDYLLVFDTVKSGKVHHEWSAILDSMDTLDHGSDILKVMGSLERYLARRGLYVRTPISEKALAKLQEVGGFAAYQDNGLIFSESMMYFFVHEDGTIGQICTVRTPETSGVIKGEPPPFRFPLPLSTEETTYLASKGKH